jgi:hypothetical protein
MYNSDKVQVFLNTIQGRQLYSNYGPDLFATWEVFGAKADNFQSGNRLTILNGFLKDIIRYVVELDGFYYCGNFGSIYKLCVQTVDSNSLAKRDVLLKEKAELINRLEVLSSKLRNHQYNQ